MTRPPRLLDASSNDAMRALLASGLEDAPDAQALPKVAAALGLATATVAAGSLVSAGVVAQASAKGAALAGSTTAVAGSTAVAGQAAASAGAAGFWGGSSALALGKTLLVSMVSAGTLSVGAVAVHEYTERLEPRAAVVERAGAVPPGSQPRGLRTRTPQGPAAGLPAVADTVTTVVVQPHVSEARRDAEARPAPAHRPESVSNAASTAAASVAERTGVLAREVRQIDSARQALESRNADDALATLDGYERSRVVGVLDREALLLKIEALSQKQELAQAKALARQYLERFPTDTHAPRMRALLGTPSSSVSAFPNE